MSNIRKYEPKPQPPSTKKAIPRPVARPCTRPVPPPPVPVPDTSPVRDWPGATSGKEARSHSGIAWIVLGLVLALGCALFLTTATDGDDRHYPPKRFPRKEGTK